MVTVHLWRKHTSFQRHLQTRNLADGPEYAASWQGPVLDVCVNDPMGALQNTLACQPLNLLPCPDGIHSRGLCRNLSNSRRCVDLPDTLCSDLSWPGSCLENISAADYTSCYPPETAPLLLRTTGPQNDHLAFLRPRFPTVKEGATGGDCGDASIEEKGSLDLQCGPIRQISTVAPRANTPSKAFARCDYSVTLVETQGSVEHVGRSPSSVSSDGLESFERRVERAQAAEAVALGEVATGRSRSKEDDEKKGAGLVELERLVFSRRLTCAACSPYTPAHSAFLDEEFRLFHWHVNRGAIAHGAGPLPLPPPPPPHGLENSTFVSFSAKANKAIARRSMNADVALDYGSHPRVLWMAAQHRAYRVDLREKPCPTTLAPTLDPTAYFNFRNRRGGDTERGAGFGGHGDVPKVRALAVGRRSAHEVFVAAGLFLACVDARFPRDVVARWDLPDEMDQLRWLPGFPGEGIAAQGKSDCLLGFLCLKACLEFFLWDGCGSPQLQWISFFIAPRRERVIRSIGPLFKNDCSRVQSKEVHNDRYQ